MDDAPPEDCSEEPGRWRPVVDAQRCSAKAACVQACPFDVFLVRRLDDDGFAKLGALGKVRSVFHGRQVAHVLRPGDCRACGLCVAVCPEGAITLVTTAPG